MVKRKFIPRKMSTQSEKRAKPSTSSESEEGEIVDKTKSSSVRRNLKNSALVKREKGKEIKKSKSSLVKGTLLKVSSMKTIDNPKIVKKEIQLSSKKKVVSKNEDITANPVDRASEESKMRPAKLTLGPFIPQPLDSTNEKEDEQSSPIIIEHSSSQPLPRFRRKCSDCKDLRISFKHDIANLRKQFLSMNRELKVKINSLVSVISQYEKQIKKFENELKSIRTEQKEDKETLIFLESVIKTFEANEVLKAKNNELQRKLDEMKNILETL